MVNTPNWLSYTCNPSEVDSTTIELSLSDINQCNGDNCNFSLKEILIRLISFSNVLASWTVAHVGLEPEKGVSAIEVATTRIFSIFCT